MHAQLNGTEIYFDVDGSQLAVGADGLTVRPTIVALHGGPGFDQGYLRPGLKSLSDDAQVVFIDLRGQGRSGRPPLTTCTIEQMADDVAALCDLLGIERPTIFGHSAGGFVALDLAIRHPSVVGGLILCDTAPTLGPLPDDRPPAGLAERAGPEAIAIAGRLFGGDMSAPTNEAFGRLVFPFYAGPTHMDVPARLMALSGFVPEVAAHFFAELAGHYDVRPRLNEITVPTLVIVGTEDWVVPPAGSRAIAGAIPTAHLVELRDAGHFGFSEEPEQFLAAVRPFVMALKVKHGAQAHAPAADQW